MAPEYKTPRDIRSERRIRNNRIRRRKELRKHFLLFLMSFCLIAACSIAVCSFRSSAKSDRENTSCKYYKSITVSESDTLWSIAERYMDKEYYESVPEYIREVMQINTLKSDAIYADAHLIIPYYDAAPETLPSYNK